MIDSGSESRSIQKSHRSNILVIMKLLENRVANKLFFVIFPGKLSIYASKTGESPLYKL